MDPALAEVDGASELEHWFGDWPSFHDAEILSLELHRKRSSVLRVHTWRMLSEVDTAGYFRTEKDVTVEFIFDEVVGLDLTDFSPQNVIFGLVVTKTARGFKIIVDPCYGLAGSIEAKRLSVKFTPGKPS